MTQAHQLHSLLIEIEQSLKQDNMWQTESPSAEAMAYQEPFAIDTMSFESWLQFVLLPRMQALLAANAALPASSHIAEMAEVVWAEQTERLALIALLRAFDQLINQIAANPTLH